VSSDFLYDFRVFFAFELLGGFVVYRAPPVGVVLVPWNEVPVKMGDDVSMDDIVYLITVTGFVQGLSHSDHLLTVLLPLLR